MKENSGFSDTDYVSLIQNMPVVSYRRANDKDWTTHFISQEIERLTEYPACEFIGNLNLNFLDIIHPDDINTVKDTIQESLHNQSAYCLEYKILTKSKKTLWVLEKGRGIVEENNNINWMDGTLIDITERKNIEQDIFLFHSLIEQSNDLIFIIDPKTARLINFNHEVPRRTGYTANELKSMTVMDIEDSLSHLNDFQKRIKSEFSSKKYARFEGTAQCQNGSTFPLEINAQYVKRNGEYILVIAHDISHRKETEKLVRLNKEKFQAITDSAQDAIIIMDGQGAISFWNKAAEKIFGYSEEEILGKNLHYTLSPRRYHADFAKGFKKFIEKGNGPVISKVTELEAVRKNGEHFSIELSLSAVKIEDQWNAIGIIRDISERKKHEDEIQQAINDLKKLQDITIDRENTLIELKQEVNTLSTELNRKEPYDLNFLDEDIPDQDKKRFEE